MFLTFEGPEGAGKSLQARALVARLQAMGRTVCATREPGGTPLGERLRDVLLSGSELNIGPRAQSLLMCAARAQLVQDVVRPALERGEMVVCDRFGDSTLAYQGYGHGVPQEEIEALIGFATEQLKPDITFLLDLSVAEGLERKRAQGSAGGAVAWDRFEREGLEFHERVRQGFLALAAREPDRWCVLDARRPPDEIAEAIWQYVAPRLG